MQRVEGSIKVYMEWDVEASRWFVAPVACDGYPLDWDVDPYVYDDEDDNAKPEPGMVEALGKADGVGVDAEQLLVLLLEATSDQAVGDNLVKHIEKVFGDCAVYSQGIPKHSRDYLMARLLPLFSSVDANAVRRTQAQYAAVTD